MAVVRCPMCGKPNPADGETCWNCDARLKPLSGGAVPGENSSVEPGEGTGPASPPTQNESEWRSENDLPDWLQFLRKDEKDAGDEPASEADFSGGLPGEMDNLPSRGEPEGPSSSPWAGEEPPAWLKDLSPEESPEPGGIHPAEEPETPEWFHLVEDERGGSSELAEEDETGAPDGDSPAAPDAGSPAWEEPEWLRQIEANQIPAGEGKEQEEIPLQESETSAPEPEAESQAGDEGQVLPASPEADILYPFSDLSGTDDLAKLPIWLASFPQDALPTEDASGESGEEPEEPGELSPGDLPNWLESMRPVEDAAPVPAILDEQDRQVEGSGPLSGLKGVIPFGPAASHPKKPLAYSVKLQVTENQQAHAAALEELIRREGEARPVPSKPALSSFTLLRWIIFILLFLGIGWYVWTGSQDVPLPAVLPEVEAASKLVNNLPGNLPVLLAIDYQPGLSAEMDAASAGVIEQLMSKGSYLALVSTAPSGPLQGERLINQLNRQGSYAYAGINQYANLGFIPGGISGLRSFAESPQRILPFALDGSPAWKDTPLNSIQGLKNFALVAVVTENPETAQAWIEQVQPLLGETPLLLVVSSQADPVVRPYYEGRPQQVQGLVTGLAGGASFEGLQRRPGLARKYWDAFSLGLFLSVLLIVIGGAASLAPVLLSKRNAAEGEKEA